MYQIIMAYVVVSPRSEAPIDPLARCVSAAWSRQRERTNGGRWRTLTPLGRAFPAGQLVRRRGYHGVLEMAKLDPGCSKKVAFVTTH